MGYTYPQTLYCAQSRGCLAEIRSQGVGVRYQPLPRNTGLHTQCSWKSHAKRVHGPHRVRVVIWVGTCGAAVYPARTQLTQPRAHRQRQKRWRTGTAHNIAPRPTSTHLGSVSCTRRVGLRQEGARGKGGRGGVELEKDGRRHTAQRHSTDKNGAWTTPPSPSP